jgi:hypothetical protein
VLPLLKYTVFRLTLFVAALVALSLAGAGRLTALIGAGVISFLLSYLLLRGPRTQVAEQIAERVERRHLRHSPADDDAAVEDAVIEDAAVEDSSIEGASVSGNEAGQASPSKKRRKQS